MEKLIEEKQKAVKCFLHFYSHGELCTPLRSLLIVGASVCLRFEQFESAKKKKKKIKTPCSQ